jgi:hypothetical protein
MDIMMLYFNSIQKQIYYSPALNILLSQNEL